MAMKWVGIALLALAWSAPLLAEGGNPGTPVPMGNPGEWVTSDDYPAVALRLNMSGAVGVGLAIAKDGTVSACRVKESSGFEILDKAACELLSARARFHPATDKKGRPIAGSWTSRFLWRIPESQNDPLRLEERLRKLRFAVSKIGAMLSCEPKDEKDQPVSDMEGVCTVMQDMTPARALLDMRGYGADDAALVEMEDYFLLNREGREELFTERRGFETRSLVIWRLSIGPDGRVADCGIVGQRGSTTLLEGYGSYCVAMAAARFKREDGGSAPLPITAWRVLRVGPIKARIGHGGHTAEQAAVN